MQAERDRLVRFVFPQLRELCIKRHLHLIDVDLRWGVTQKEAEEGKVLELCLDEIERCRPFFLGLLGERYGFVPKSYELPDEPRYDWLRHFDPGHSITALEIYHGVLRNPQMAGRAFFYFRDPGFVEKLPENERTLFAASSPEEAQKLARLKAEIRDQFKVKQYAEPDEKFEDLVLRELWEAIDSEYPEETEAAQDELALERAHHDAFIEDRSRNFVGRLDLLSELKNYADGSRASHPRAAPQRGWLHKILEKVRKPDQDAAEASIMALPLLVTGKPGSGKSGLLAKFAADYATAHPEVFILTHFVGASPGSTDVRETLLRFCREIVQRFNINEDIPQQYEDLRMFFRQLLERTNDRLLLIVDALNQFETILRPADLSWLPAKLRGNVRIIVSSLEGEWLEEFHRREQETPEIEVGPIQDSERRTIVRQSLDQYRKRLAEESGSDEISLLLGKLEADRPLYLAVACEELRVFGRFGHVRERIVALPEEVPGLFGQVLERLEADHGKALMREALSLIACSRYGLVESDLLVLLKPEGEDQLPQAIWARAYRSLQFYLRAPGETHKGRVGFFHEQLKWAVEQRYLGTYEIERAIHHKLANHFRRKADPAGDSTFTGEYAGAFVELPYQLARAGQKSEIEELLLTYGFLRTKLRIVGLEPLIQDFQLTIALQSETGEKISASEPHRLVQRALSQSSHVLLKDQQQLASQLYSRLLGVPHPSLRPLKRQLEPETGYLLPLWPPLVQADDFSLRRLEHRSVTSIVLSKDGRFLYSGSSGGLIRFWEVATGRQLRRIVSGHVHALILSSNVGKLFSGGWFRDNTVRAYQAESGFELPRMTGHKKWVKAMALTADGLTLFSDGDDETIRIWGAKDGSSQGIISATGEVSALAVTADGTTLFSGAQRSYSKENDITIRLWDTASRRQVGRLEGHSDNVTTLLLSAAGDILYSGSADASIRAWDVRSGSALLCLRGHRGSVTSLVLTPDGQTLYSASTDHTVCAWDARTGRRLEVLGGFSGTTSALALSPGGETLYCSDEHQIHARATRSQLAGAARELAHASEIDALIFSPDGARLFSASADNTIGVWDSETGRGIGRLSGHPGPIEALALNAIGNLLLSTSNASSAEWHGVSTAAELKNFIAIRLWNTQSLQKVGERPNPDLERMPSGDPYSASLAAALLKEAGAGGRASWSHSVLSEDRRTLFTAVMGKGDISVTNALNGNQIRSFTTRPTRVTALALHPSERTLFCGYADGALREIDALTGREVRRLEGHNTWLRALAMVSSEDLLVSAGDDLALRIWDATSGVHLGTFYPDAPVRCFATTQSGDIAAGDAAGRLFVFWPRRGDKPRTARKPQNPPSAGSPVEEVEVDPMAFWPSPISLSQNPKPADPNDYKAGPDWFLFRPGDRNIRILCPQCNWHDTWDRAEEKPPEKCPRCSFPDPPASHV
jgi:telomerase protein component 1